MNHKEEKIQISKSENKTAELEELMVMFHPKGSEGELDE